MVKRFTFWFAFIAYFLTFLYYYGPHGIGRSQLLYNILPFWMCILTLGGMPVQAVALIIAPVNALLYGILGAIIGVFASTFKTWRRPEQADSPD